MPDNANQIKWYNDEKKRHITNCCCIKVWKTNVDFDNFYISDEW